MRVGSDKFLFGTDFPMPYEGGLHRMIDFVNCIRMLPISNELKALIFHGNFDQLMEVLI